MVETSDPKTCATCRFSHLSGANDLRCRRYPPQMIFAVQPMESYPASVFPAVDADHWCGEHGVGKRV